MDIVGVSGTGADTHEVAKCLSTVRVNVAGTCDVTINAPAAGGSFVDALWATSGQSTKTYKQYQECPVVTGTAVTPTGGAAATPTDMQAAILAALNAHVYSGAKSSGINGITYTAGVVAVTAGTLTWTYAIKASTVAAAEIAAGVVVVPDGTNLAAAQFKSGDLGVSCGAGRFGVVVGDIKLCPLCPAGTAGDGFGCTSCAAGSQSALGGTCANCLAGSYANGGNSDCLPCPAGTYSGAAAGECTEW